jgi:hypothetical protein
MSPLLTLSVCTLHMFCLPIAALLHPDITQRTPPPCAAQCAVVPLATFSQPSTVVDSSRKQDSKQQQCMCGTGMLTGLFTQVCDYLMHFDCIYAVEHP